MSIVGCSVERADLHAHFKVRYLAAAGLVLPREIYSSIHIVFVELPRVPGDVGLFESVSVAAGHIGVVEGVRGREVRMMEAFDVAVFEGIGFVERVDLHARHSAYYLYIYKLNFIWLLYATNITSREIIADGRA